MGLIMDGNLHGEHYSTRDQLRTRQLVLRTVFEWLTAMSMTQNLNTFPHDAYDGTLAIW